MEDIGVPHTDTLLALSDAALAYLGFAILLDGQKNWLSRLICCLFLPGKSSHLIIQRGQRGVR